MQAVKQFLKKHFGRWIYRSALDPGRYAAMQQQVAEQLKLQPDRLSDTAFDLFTYHGEDGIIAYLLQQVENVPHRFIDIGAGDGIKSNCAVLAIHAGWSGVFIDRDEKQLAVGKRFYKARPELQFVSATVTPASINALLKTCNGDQPVGLLSIDIDGNDFWTWNAIDQLQPRIVVIEAKVEFGLRAIAVPEGSANHASVDRAYNGASVEAFRRLGISKGYRLVGANKQGYNLFFVQEPSVLPAVSTEAILNDPETIASFYPDGFFTSHPFETINSTWPK